MPCNCDGMEESLQWRRFKEKHNLALMDDLSGYMVFSLLKHNMSSDECTASSVKHLVDKCNSLAELLCVIGRAYYEKAGIPEAAIQWWKEHCLIDAARGEAWPVEPTESVGVE